MSSARKRAYKHKAYAEIDHLKQQLTLKSYHYDHMTAMNQALAKAGDEARAENARLRTALEMIEWIDGYEESTGEFVFCPCCNREKKHGHYDCRLEEALKGTL